ncbi:MAG: response regulator transcription factor [Bacteroidetes bacterium]|nr:response regulator transcription factor [Bacteroidota bacterium]
MNVFLVDDEEQAQVTMNYYLREFFPDISVIGTASDIVTAGKEIIRLKPDLVFLDISMPDGTGFDLLERISQSGALFVFVSAHKDFAFDAIKINIFDYLLKPLQVDELTRVVSKARNHLNSRPRSEPNAAAKLQIKADGRVMLLEQNEIVFISSEGNYSTIHTVSGKCYLITKNIKKLEDDQFGGLPFFRIHQSYIINLSKVKQYDAETVLVGENSIPVSKAKMDAFRQALSDL